jgi:hypothetical protein
MKAQMEKWRYESANSGTDPGLQDSLLRDLDTTVTRPDEVAPATAKPFQN